MGGLSGDSKLHIGKIRKLLLDLFAGAKDCKTINNLKFLQSNLISYSGMTQTLLYCQKWEND